MSVHIHNARVLRDRRIVSGSLEFDDRIRPIGSPRLRVDAHGQLVTPGLVDLHVHGLETFVFERGPECLTQGLRRLPRYGVTSVLPTLYRCLSPDSLNHVAHLAGAIDTPDGARVPGFHLEGPFLAITGAGALTMKPDLTFLGELLAAAGRVAAVSISPELPGILGVIEHLVERKIAAFITHTQASAEQTQAAIDAGARHATHFYDVFPLPRETDPGVRPVGAVEAIVADPRVTVDFICDGIHVHPAAIRMAIAAKGLGGVVAITDGNVGAGLADGTYSTPWGYDVRVSSTDAARIASPSHPQQNQLAGSSLTLDRAVANLRRLGLDEAAAFNAASANAVAVINLADRGTLAEGEHADLVLWDVDLRPRAVWIGGKCVYRREKD